MVWERNELWLSTYRRLLILHAVLLARYAQFLKPLTSCRDLSSVQNFDCIVAMPGDNVGMSDDEVWLEHCNQNY